MRETSRVFRMAARSSAMLAMGAMSFAASQALAQEDDNPYAHCLSHCEDLIGEARLEESDHAHASGITNVWPHVDHVAAESIVRLDRSDGHTIALGNFRECIARRNSHLSSSMLPLPGEKRPWWWLSDEPSLYPSPNCACQLILIIGRS